MSAPASVSWPKRPASSAALSATAPEPNRRGKMPVNKLKSGVVKLEEINEGFDRLSDGTVLRQMLKPNG